jgi:uncharacterized protein with PIN domain
MVKFLCDQMLGDLAKWLRFLGFDTYYANNEINDDDLLKISKNENRVLLTKDKELIIRAKKIGVSNIKVDLKMLDDQIIQVLKTSKVKINNKDILSRCSKCNDFLNKVNKDDVKESVPPLIFKNNDLFWKCDKCKTVYWKGSHHEKIISKINKINTKL